MNAQAVWEQAQLGANWLARQQDSDGESRGLTNPAIDGYYKAS